MDMACFRFCVLAMMTSITYSTKQKTGENLQQLLSQLSNHDENATRYIDLSVSLIGTNVSQYTQDIFTAITNVDQVFQKQLNTSVILSNFQHIPTTPSLESSSNEEIIRSLPILTNNSKSDSSFLVRFLSSSSVESTVNTMCSTSFTGGVINVVAMDDIGALARMFMYGIGRNLGFVDSTNVSDTCQCNTKSVCMMDSDLISTSSSENLLQTSVSNCNINKFKERQNACFNDQPKQLPDLARCGNGRVESGEQCDCQQDDSKCKKCCDKCSNDKCCPNCQFIRACNSRDCICKDLIGKGSVASHKCLDQLQTGDSSAFCGIAQNCSILKTECDIVLCRTEDEVVHHVSESIKVTNVSITGSPLCSNLYAVESIRDDGFFLTDGIMCEGNDGVCISGKCDETYSCNNKNRGFCLNNGVCDDKTNKCLCKCGWSGHRCNIPDGNKMCGKGLTNTPTESTTGVQTTHIIAGFIGIFFAAAVVSGATSIGYKRLQKRNRLQTKHERNMLSLFEPTREQKKRLARQYNKRSDHDFHYNERYRIPTDSNVEQRLMDEGMPPPILCTAAKHSRDVSVI